MGWFRLPQAQSGLSITLTGAIKGRKGIGQDNADTLWGKIGYSSGLFDIGKTHFGLSYGQYNDFAQDGDEATPLRLRDRPGP